MKKIKSRRFKASRYTAVLAAAAVSVPTFVAPLIANAADVEDVVQSNEHHRRHEDVIVHGDKKKREVSSVKKTEPLLNTPQTVTVIDSKTMEEQGAISLMDALQNTPGITMQLGENGNTVAGDAFRLRGSNAANSVFVDGVKDMGAVSRDVFNIEQVEIAKGAVGSEAGRGASTGYINMVSKRANRDRDNSIEATGYSQGGARASVDLSYNVGENSAFRLNAFGQDIDTAGRDFVDKTGWGIAPAFSTKFSDKTRLDIFGLYVKQDNVPDGGVPTIGLDGYYSATEALNNASRVSSKNYYGSRDDSEKTEVYMGTIQISHEVSDNLRFTNTTRFGTTTMDRTLTGVYEITATDTSDPSSWTLRRLRQGVDQENSIFANQFNAVAKFKTGVLTHDFVAGFEAISEKQTNKTISFVGTQVEANVYNPSTDDAFTTSTHTGAYTQGESTTFGLYAFDTIKYGEKWLFNLGVRADNYDTNYLSVTAANVPTELSAQDTLLTWNVGAVYKPVPYGSIYVSYSDSKTPPGVSNSDVGSTTTNDFGLSTSGSNISNPNMDPRTTEHVEIGTKWEFFHGHLALTAAAYQDKTKNDLVRQDPTDPSLYTQYGEKEIKGYELSVTGNITPRWNVIAGFAYEDTEVTEGTNSSSATNTTNPSSSETGSAFAWSAPYSGNIWTTYKITPKLLVGIGANYKDAQKRVTDPKVNYETVRMPEIPSSTVVNAMLSYNITPRAYVRLNVYNVFDEDYIVSLNKTGARAILGAPRSASLTVNYRF